MGDYINFGGWLEMFIRARMACMENFIYLESSIYLLVVLRAVGGVLGPPIYSFFAQLHGGEHLTAFLLNLSW